MEGSAAKVFRHSVSRTRAVRDACFCRLLAPRRPTVVAGPDTRVFPKVSLTLPVGCASGMLSWSVRLSSGCRM